MRNQRTTTIGNIATHFTTTLHAAGVALAIVYIVRTHAQYCTAADRYAELIAGGLHGPLQSTYCKKNLVPLIVTFPSFQMVQWWWFIVNGEILVICGCKAKLVS
jgi:hypothetical protein